MADLAGLDLFVEHLEGFFQRGEQVLRRVLVTQLAEEVGAALGPVQLVEVDPVGLQALEAVVQGGDDVLAVVLEQAVANMVDAVAGPGHLAGQDPLGTVAALAEPVADHALGGGVGFRAGRDGIHLGSIDEIDPGGLGPFDLGEGLGLVVLLAPGHAAQAQGADVEIGSAQLAIVHSAASCLKEA
ncbi:hypothetical protein D3C81_1605530 [compost metagenome]